MITVIGTLKGGAGKSTVTFNLGLWLATAGKAVVAYDLDPQCTLIDALDVRKEEALEPALKVYSRYQKNNSAGADEIVIDVGSANMQGMKRAITMAERVLVPVTPSQADIWSTQRFLYLVASTVSGKPPEILMFMNRADTHNTVRETEQAEQALKTLPGIKVLDTRLCQRTVYRHCFSEGKAVFELAPSGKAAKEFLALARIVYPGVSA